MLLALVVGVGVGLLFGLDLEPLLDLIFGGSTSVGK